MLYIHESNLINKVRTNYHGKGDKIEKFYNEVYVRYREKLEELNYISENIEIFKEAAKLIDEYLIEIENFSITEDIKSQSKFRSTFIEEISSYLFKELPLIKDHTFDIFNKNVFSGIKINNRMHVDVIPKDVDFCIGKKVSVEIDGTQSMQIIIPIVCVEVKTYLDATMFGEVQFSSKQIKNGSPNAKTYVLMEHNEVAAEKIIAARYDNNLNEMFVLRKGRRGNNLLEKSLDANVLLEYYKEIKNSIENAKLADKVETPGRLLKPIDKKEETD